MNQYNPNKHHRRSIRLKGYDYSQAGLYFITICCENRAYLFGEIIDGEMTCNDAGIIANQCWLDIPNHFPNVVLHEYVVMPNHIHGIIEIVVGAKNISPEKISPESLNTKYISHNNTITNDMVAYGETDDINAKNMDNGDIWAKNISPLPRQNGTSKTIGSMVRGFKIGVTKWMRQHTNVNVVWQRNYYEHIIRNEQSHQTISNYIINNPTKWVNDKFFMK